MDSVRSSICRSCRLRLIQQKARTFSTSSTRRIVPPESPYYVDIPSSYQPYQPFAKQQKGTLPVPRELFPASRPDKPSKEYLSNVTQDQLEKNKIPPQKMTNIAKHKSKMSETRKEQLREGLTGLYARKEAELSSMARKSQAKQLQRDELLKQAEREDARLTNVSTQKEMEPSTQASLEALEAEVAVVKRIHEQKVANLRRAQAVKKEQKMDSLHTLYMNARSFVTTEHQLNNLIHAQFDTSVADGMGTRTIMHADFENQTQRGDSMWNLGAPDSIKDMIAGSQGKVRGGGLNMGAVSRLRTDESRKSRGPKDQERMKRIAEKLSGGKI